VSVEAGTKERKRALEAMPPRIRAGWSPGCTGALLGCLVLGLSVYWTTGSWWWLMLAVPALLVLVVAVADQVLDVVVLAGARQRLAARGIRCLVVYSNSPTWEEHIRHTWLPRLGQCAVTLNWSDRSSWPASLETGLFKRFVRSRRNFNPAVLVLRGLRQPHVYRFYYAFQHAKHGRGQYLQALETELFDELGL
jgi:hypothetical protein